jgi:hypothetical protein
VSAISVNMVVDIDSGSDALADAVRVAIGDTGVLGWRVNGNVLSFFSDPDNGVVGLPCELFAPLIAALAEEWARDNSNGNGLIITRSPERVGMGIEISFEPTTIVKE